MEKWRDKTHPADFPVNLEKLGDSLPKDLVDEAVEYLNFIGWEISKGRNADAHNVLRYADALQMPERNLRGTGILDQARAYLDHINYGLQEEL